MRYSFPLLLLVSTFTAFAQPSSFVVESISINDFIEKRLEQLATHNGSRLKLQEICPIDKDPIASRVFNEYGAAFVAHESVKMPSRCIFDLDADVAEFQDGLEIETLLIGVTKIELQAAAARGLRMAVDDALKVGKRITPLDGAIAGRRSYRDTLRIWNSRFFRALDHWVLKGKITREEANYAATLPIKDQIVRVMDWESKGYYFSTNFSISIFNSVAPPGTSQHLSLIAFDVVEASDPTIRKILNEHGWFQTIKTDEPHFTYLGVSESELPSRGLKQFKRAGHTYWIPNI